MSLSAVNSTHSNHDFGHGAKRAVDICKQILNLMAALAHRQGEQARFAALPMRQLEDIGLTIAERDDLLPGLTIAQRDNLIH
jgi:hypothetical protein